MICMEYSKDALEVLNLMQRKDFKNISKNEVINLASKLGELNPEVARDIIAQFPEVVTLLNNTVSEYKSVLEEIIRSDDSSTDTYYEINKKGIDSVEKSRSDFKDLTIKVLDDFSKATNDPNLTINDKIEILNNETKILKLIQEHDKEAFEEQKYYENKAYEKDSEKKQFNWKILGTASVAVISLVGVGVAALSGSDFKIKLPNKN